MGKAGELISGFQVFLGDVRMELSKCSWPTRPELVESTIVVIISCLILAGFVGISDAVLMALTSVVIR